METSPKDYVDTLDSDNSLEFDNSMDFEESWNYYVFANSKDSKDAPKIVSDCHLRPSFFRKKAYEKTCIICS